MNIEARVPQPKSGRHPEKALTDRGVKAKSEPGMYADGNGLYLKIEKSGAKRWVQRLVIRGRRTDLGLGSVSLVSLAKARAEALENRRIARAGGDPVQERRRANAVPTFDTAVEDYLEIKLAEFSNEKHRKQWRTSLRDYASPVIGSLKVSDITLRDVLRVLEPIWSDKTETASRLRGRIEAVLAWATVAGHRDGDNPARWKGNLDQMLAKPSKVAKTGNHAALSPDNAARWWNDLQRRSGIAAQGLQFLTLTVARSGEVRGMTWDEVDLDKALWTVPAERMKAGREHRVPLTGAALSLLKALPRMKASPYVFFAPRGGMLSDMSISAVMRRMHVDAVKKWGAGYLDPRAKRPAVPHGLRSTFRDWAAEHGIERDLAEMALAHTVGSEVERAYRRTDLLERRRTLLERWEGFLKADAKENVVPFNDPKAL
tara:strand:- start:2504 stop:3793 length:1290 start_codon:yes stop_codon:yes gene_type:complete